jgi:prevent-host-death family protein
MREVNIHEAKTQFSKLLRRVAAGEEISIANRGVPVARLVPATRRKEHRKLGVESGRLKIAEDFDASLPAEVLAGFLATEKKSKRKRR